jgi:hypothetical protein
MARAIAALCIKEEQPGDICLSHALKFIYNGIFSIY